MSRVARKTRHIPAHLLNGFAVLLLTSWGALALWFQSSQHSVVRWVAIVVWSALGVSVVLSLSGLFGRKRRNITGFVFVLATACLLLWWGTLRPSHQRAWADDVAQLLEARVEGNHVHLKNVRNFEWRSETDYTPR